MKTDKYLNDYKNTVHRSNLLKGVIALLIAGIVAQGITIAYMSLNTSIIVIPNVQRKFVINKTNANKAYMTVMIKYIVNLYENYTAASAKKQFDDLLAYFNPSDYHNLQSYITSRLANIKQYDISSWFVINKIRLKTRNAAVVIGYKKTFMTDSLVSDKQIAILIHYTFNNHIFSVSDFKVMPYSQYQEKFKRRGQ